MKKREQLPIQLCSTQELEEALELLEGRWKDGILVEHWDVIQDEATRESSKSGLPMFGEEFGG